MHLGCIIAVPTLARRVAFWTAIANEGRTFTSANGSWYDWSQIIEGEVDC